jgi:uncharacterized membrane protein
VNPRGGWWAVAGTLAVVLASIAYAVGSLWAQHLVERESALVITTASLIGAALALLPFGLAQLPDSIPGWKVIGSVVALGVAGTAIGQLIYYRMIETDGSARTSLVTYLLPVTALFYGAGLLGEPITVEEIVGLVLILAGVALGSAAMVSSPGVVVALWLVAGTATALATVAAASLVLERFDGGDRLRAASAMRTVLDISFPLGVVVGGFLAWVVDVRVAFATAGGLLVAAAIFAAVVGRAGWWTLRRDDTESWFDAEAIEAAIRSPRPGSPGFLTADPAAEAKMPRGPVTKPPVHVGSRIDGVLKDMMGGLGRPAHEPAEPVPEFPVEEEASEPPVNEDGWPEPADVDEATRPEAIIDEALQRALHAFDDAVSSALLRFMPSTAPPDGADPVDASGGSAEDAAPSTVQAEPDLPADLFA